jgi:hypothetical protein
MSPAPLAKHTPTHRETETGRSQGKEEIFRELRETDRQTALRGRGRERNEKWERKERGRLLYD